MKLQELERSQFDSLAREVWGGELSDADAIAGALRSELWARRVTSRRGLCDRIIQMFAPIEQLSLDSVKQVLEDLERTGDATPGPRGMVAAAPLRAVDVGGHRYLLFGSIPDSTLRELLPNLEVVIGLRRWTDVPPTTADVFPELVAGGGGIVVSAERWSSIHRALTADGAWIEELNERLSNDAHQPSVAPDQCAGEWQHYAPDADRPMQRKRWRQGGGENAQLWRVRTIWAKWAYAWTSGGSPEDRPSHHLWSDDAHRAAFALDRTTGHSLRFSARADGEYRVLRVDAMLPQAEYRYLVTMGDRLDADDGSPSYRIRSSAWPAVEKVLEQQLGVSFVSAEQVS